MSIRVTTVQSYSYSPLNSRRDWRSIVSCTCVQHLHSPGLHWQLLMECQKEEGEQRLERTSRRSRKRCFRSRPGWQGCLWSGEEEVRSRRPITLERPCTEIILRVAGWSGGLKDGEWRSLPQIAVDFISEVFTRVWENVCRSWGQILQFFRAKRAEYPSISEKILYLRGKHKLD